MLNRDFKFFDAARQVALTSDFKVKVGAVAVYGGYVVAASASSNKTHPLQRQYNAFREFDRTGVVMDKLHAEIGLLTHLYNMRLDRVDMKNVSIYVYRVCRSREHGIARPCAGCMKALIDAGIRNVYYTTDVGFAYEQIGEHTSRQVS